ncbi:MAG TPA: DNA-processing protein DprA [Patescibacteria group bacterium]|nr:DNA-processing protein DprA [Patescibacteria group bacterium]
MLQNELPYLHAIHVWLASELPRLHLLMRQFGSAKKIWNAPIPLLQAARFQKETIQRIVNLRSQLSVQQLWQHFCELQHKQQVRLITINDAVYPPLLKEIAQPPYVLYCRGNVQLFLETRAIAIVGTRKATTYGKRVVKDIVQHCVGMNAVTVSGLAFGIDAAVHKETIDADGKTIAVLGSSVLDNEIAPSTHRVLAQNVLKKNGLIISEYPPNTPTNKWYFPERNRIIAGLTQATIVVEASLKSGSLITARYARESNREVLAVPGSLYTDLACGTNALIAQGATSYLSFDSLLGMLQHLPAYTNIQQKETPPLFLSLEEKAVLHIFQSAPLSLDKAIEQSGLPTAQILSIVTSLTLKGALLDLDNGLFSAQQ